MKKCYFEADVLLPDFKEVDPSCWAVIACDQFTSEEKYWKEVSELVLDKPSTLNLILPEVYLSDSEKRIPDINDNMKKYERELLSLYPESMIYIQRTQSDGSVRRGVLLCVDLECYDYRKGADALIRATEATVVERIPPRVAIRRNATLELPHVMLLIDDPNRTVIEPLEKSECGKTIYDFDLMQGGGHIKGILLNNSAKKKLSSALDLLATPDEMQEKYGDSTLAPLLFAVGDGNHSLASAKAAYEEIKANIGIEAAASHPARYALVEAVNIHDSALKFEPIYRIMTGVDVSDVLSSLEKYISSLEGKAGTQTIKCIWNNGEKELTVQNSEQQLAVGTLQIFIDKYISEHKGVEVDYIHGEESVISLANKENSIGFIFKGMEKSELFKTVIFDGALPRKTFSMGHAEDKRYYLEARKIKR